MTKKQDPSLGNDQTPAKVIVNKLVSIALLAGGIVLVLFGIKSMSSFASNLSRFYTGMPSETAMWMLIGGIIASLVGLVWTLRSWKRV